MLKSLAERGVIEVIRLAEERTVVRILPQHRSFRPAVSPGKPVDRVAAIKQLVLRMTGQRPGLEDVRRMELESGTDEQGLLDALRVLLNKGSRYENFDSLIAGVFYQLRNPYW